MVAQFEALCRKLDEREKLNQERMDAHEKWAVLKFESMDREVVLARTDMDRRLEGMNNFEARMTKQAEEMASKTYVDLKVDKLDSRANLNMDNINLILQNRSMDAGARRWTDYIITSGIAFIIFLIGHFVFKF